jgi:hypothetical protein
LYFYYFLGVVLWALIIQGIKFHSKKIVAGPRVSVSNQYNKKTADPTPNKSNPGSLTIIAHDTGPLVGISRQTVRGLLKFSHQYLL